MSPFHVDHPDAFTADGCDAIIALAERRGLEPATVWSGTGDHVDPQVRRASRVHLDRAPAMAWIHDRLDGLFADVALRFGVTVAPLFEPIQVVRYGEGDHFQTWHSDAGADLYGERTLSLSVELSDPTEHEGGVLEIAPGTVGAVRTLPRGSARIFLSRAIHRVTPVRRGTRYALVAWTGTPQPR